MYADVLTEFLVKYTSFSHSRELIAGIFFILDLVVVGVFSAYAVSKYEYHKTWTENLPIRGALALTTYFLGQLIIRFWAWSSLRFRGDGGTSMVDYGMFGLYLFGTAVSVTGIIWIIHVLTPPWFRPWHWVIGVPTGFLILYLTRA